ncbi:MAG: four helix bundle protein, partial [Bacteroidetes bacterium]|nr:four helix bundle protein [Bacteroidota bacterium]
MEMGKIISYHDLEVWKKAVICAKEVYRLTENFPEKEKYGLTSQIRRATVSVPANIAEGWGRESSKNFIQFLRTARGSLYELDT